ncbi:hypothetical protein L6164_016889 [Bauhinia variegata]|uniref:Uncharacterized protein n=1 Tax=Bauhinia variegata TaxID=167791 RepID=A0ACB9N698_BAUVA|nr:hypothetical protein L6164_016889 [Bauhinia variegata]
MNLDAYRFSKSWSTILPNFQEYADICFKEFGDRAKYWITLNEPWTVSQSGYASGSMAPGCCSDWMNLDCTGGDTGREPYFASHNPLLAHAAAVRLYRIKYKCQIKKPDQDAAQRALDFNYGWFMEPLTTGEYTGTNSIPILNISQLKI